MTKLRGSSAQNLEFLDDLPNKHTQAPVRYGRGRQNRPNSSTDQGGGKRRSGIQFVSSGFPKVGEAIRSAAWHYCRASILSLYGRGLPTSCTFCGAVSRGDERPRDVDGGGLSAAVADVVS